MNEAIRMQLSAFADGELPDNEKELLLRRLSQDPSMRRQLAEYFAIGRAMRGEAPVPGIESLRDRVAAAIGTLDLPQSEAVTSTAGPATPRGRRLLRPVAGLATAAAVALLVIVGLQRLSHTPATVDVPPSVAENDGFSTQPEPDKLLDQYRRMHEAEAAGSSIRTRFTSIELRQGLAVEADTPEQQPNAESDDPEQAADPAAADE
jgi:negative regulator of sigma E activity